MYREEFHYIESLQYVYMTERQAAITDLGAACFYAVTHFT